MSKKRFDDIEEVIRKLAESGEPAFDERAWQKMEVFGSLTFQRTAICTTIGEGWIT